MKRSRLPIIQATAIHCLLLLIEPAWVEAQMQFPPEAAENEIEAQFEPLVEDLSGQFEENFDASELLQELQYKKLNLNILNGNEMAATLLLNDLQINNLQEYIRTYGPLVTIYELQLIRGFDPATIHQIASRCAVAPPQQTAFPSVPLLMRQMRGQVMCRYARFIEPQKGYEKNKDTSQISGQGSHYLGTPSKMLVRFSVKSGESIGMGFTAEKDAGEEFFSNSQKQGFDFYSAYLAIKPGRILQSLVIGDFRLSFGQGLTLNTTSSLRMINGLYEPYRLSTGLKPYTSSNEEKNLSGIGVVIKTGRLEWTLFASRKKLDSRIEIYDTASQKIISAATPSTNGYHRTINEISRKNILEQTLLGGHIGYKNNFLHLGFTGFRLHYDASIAAGQDPYEQFYFSGNESICLGLDTRILLPHAMLFAEATKALHRSAAMIAGLYLYAHPRFRYTLVYRYYGKSSDNPLGMASGIQSVNRNETGITVSVVSLITSKLTITANTDLHWYPWLKYRSDRPSSGKEVRISIDFQPAKNALIGFRYVWGTSEENFSTGQRIVTPSVSINRQLFRFQLSHQISYALKLITQVQVSLSGMSSCPPQKGYLLSQDISYRFPKIPLGIELRYALFDTDSYENRIYSYERDVLNAFSAPAYYSKGVRFCSMIRYTLFDRLDIWLRFCRTILSEDDLIGSGPDEITGNTKSEVKAQVRYQF
jgi:hypothetical protein